MGTHFKKAIFDEHVQVGIVGWAQKVKKKKGLQADGSSSQPQQASPHDASTAGIQLGSVFRRASAAEDNPPAPKSEETN